MKKKGFTIIELLIVILIVGVLLGIGGMSIKKHAMSKSMLKVRNEVGDFFRLASKRSKETGEKYVIHLKLDEKLIEIERNGTTTDTIELPNNLEYGITWGSSFVQTFNVEMESYGNLDRKFSLYFVEGNGVTGINGEEEVKYVISFNSDNHIKYLHVREYIPINEITASKILSDDKSPSANPDLKLIKD